MNIREKTCVFLFEKSKIPYSKIFKKRKVAWDYNRVSLLKLNSGTFGHHLGEFLTVNNFELIPRLERHDAYHVLTGFGTDVKDEIALQFMCFGNGKRSKYLFLVLIFGTILNPEHWKYFKESYEKGKNANQFYHWDFKDYLHVELKLLHRKVFKTELI